MVTQSVARRGSANCMRRYSGTVPRDALLLDVTANTRPHPPYAENPPHEHAALAFRTKEKERGAKLVVLTPPQAIGCYATGSVVKVRASPPFSPSFSSRDDFGFSEHGYED
ncbi:hypothetical protein MTO96_014578 [Rhipicephalus appendiculatus]